MGANVLPGKGGIEKSTHYLLQEVLQYLDDGRAGEMLESSFCSHTSGYRFRFRRLRTRRRHRSPCPHRCHIPRNHPPLCGPMSYHLSAVQGYAARVCTFNICDLYKHEDPQERSNTTDIIPERFKPSRRSTFQYYEQHIPRQDSGESSRDPSYEGHHESPSCSPISAVTICPIPAQPCSFRYTQCKHRNY